MKPIKTSQIWAQSQKTMALRPEPTQSPYPSINFQRRNKDQTVKVSPKNTKTFVIYNAHFNYGTIPLQDDKCSNLRQSHCFSSSFESKCRKSIACKIKCKKMVKVLVPRPFPWKSSKVRCFITCLLGVGIFDMTWEPDTKLAQGQLFLTQNTNITWHNNTKS